MISNMKLEIVEGIKDVSVQGLSISKYATKPDTFTKLPAITYHTITEGFRHTFNKTISQQTAVFQIDIWANKSSDISSILISLKETMLSKGIYYVGGSDFNDPSGIKRFITNFKIKK